MSEFLISYVDDILLLTNGNIPNANEAHLKVLEFALFCTERMGLKMARNKVEVFKKSFIFMGHSFENQQLGIPIAKLNNFEQMRRPRSQAELISRLGAVAYFDHCLPQLRKIILPLTEMSKSDKGFRWEDVHNAA